MALNKKKRPKRPPNKHARLVEARAKAIEKKIATLLNQMVGKLLATVLWEIKTYGTPSKTIGTTNTQRRRVPKPPEVKKEEVKKTLSDSDIRRLTSTLSTKEGRELVRLLTRFGIIQAASAGSEHTQNPAKGTKPRKFLVTPSFEMEYGRNNVVLIQQLEKNIEKTYREGVSNALGVWLKEEPQPDTREISRRLRTHHFLPKEKWTDADKGLLKPLKNSTSIVGLANRSMTIARTEVARARNAGNTEGMMQAGFTHHTWVTTFDEFTREGHTQMDNITVRLGESFVTPDGNWLQFPGDPYGEPSEVINCRCVTVPVDVDQKT